ncbi:MAG: DUF4892 domain-containing protein [Desulfobulbus sp.]
MASTPVMAATVSRDVDGSQDSPLLGRYEGSFIIGYAHKAYDDFVLPLSAPQTFEPELEQKTRVEGKHTRIIYLAPENRSTLEVFRNYQNELAANNAEILFSCEKDTCGKKEGQVLIQKILYPAEGRLKNINQVTSHAFSFPVDMRYLAAKISSPKEAYFSIFVAQETFTHFKETASRVLVLLDVIEPEAMEEKMVVVPAEKMAEELNAKGSFSLYGIYFDTDSSVIKPESRESLVEIEKLLRQNPKIKLYIVGHTDNVGGFDYNLSLSRKRAQAVADALVQHHGVDATRLGAHGVGMLAPKASNETDEGRGFNRRVELVKQ